MNWHKIVERSENISLRSTRVLALGGLTSLLILAVMVAADVLMRWLFSNPIEGVRDIAEVAIAVAVSASLPTVLARRENVTIRFMGRILGRRGSQALDLFGDIVVLVILIIMSWQFIRFSNELSAAGDATLILRVPLAPWWYLSTAIIASTIPVQLVVIVANCARRKNGEDSVPGPNILT